MSLYRLHRLLIVAAIALGTAFALHSGARFQATGERLAAWLAAFSAAAAAVLAVYLRWFVRRRGGAAGSRG